MKWTFRVAEIRINSKNAFSHSGVLEFSSYLPVFRINIQILSVHCTRCVLRKSLRMLYRVRAHIWKHRTTCLFCKWKKKTVYERLRRNGCYQKLKIKSQNQKALRGNHFVCFPPLRWTKHLLQKHLVVHFFFWFQTDTAFSVRGLTMFILLDIYIGLVNLRWALHTV